jgi:hypothetical protein
MPPGSDIRVGNAPVSWGVYEADSPNPPFASVLDGTPMPATRGTELGPYGYTPTDARLWPGAEVPGLALGSQWSPAARDSQRRQRCVDTTLVVARLLATRACAR